MSDLYKNTYNPDVLSCLANLSNDEVFTPPEIANAMLDLLPKEIWHDSKATFLDPVCKSGIFLREIAKRLIEGLKDEFPDLQERIDHIFHKQLFGIAITELTSLLSRRSVYCSKFPNGVYSITRFKNEQGNIKFNNIKHTWKEGKCIYCGASQKEYDRGLEFESHAYQFIHHITAEDLFNMKFDVIIGNPPYQLSFGIEGGNSANAKSIYNLFIEQSLKLKPRYICMITPSRWMTKSAQGVPESWIDKMIKSNNFKIIHDFENASDCFPGVSIKGGVNYFLLERDFKGKCEYYYHKTNNLVLSRIDYLDSMNAGIVIRDPSSFSIIKKIENIDKKYYQDPNTNFSGYVSPKHFFDNSSLLTSNWKDYQEHPNSKYCIKYYLNVNHERTFRWISEDQIPKNKDVKNLHKIFIPGAGGSGFDDQIIGKPFYGEPNSVCSQTFLVIGFDCIKHNFSESECKNIISYIKTRFFRYLVSIKKKTQNGPRGVYQFVPLQDFSKPWTDEELYKKYDLSSEQIEYIESLIKPMELEEN